jgi:hypothetical protein
MALLILIISTLVPAMDLQLPYSRLTINNLKKGPTILIKTSKVVKCFLNPTSKLLRTKRLRRIGFPKHC